MTNIIKCKPAMEVMDELITKNDTWVFEEIGSQIEEGACIPCDLIPMIESDVMEAFYEAPRSKNMDSEAYAKIQRLKNKAELIASFINLLRHECKKCINNECWLRGEKGPQIHLVTDDD